MEFGSGNKFQLPPSPKSAPEQLQPPLRDAAGLDLGFGHLCFWRRSYTYVPAYLLLWPQRMRRKALHNNRRSPKICACESRCVGASFGVPFWIVSFEMSKLVPSLSRRRRSHAD